jgi:exosome complex RNA-binding protein Rrp4
METYTLVMQMVFFHIVDPVGKNLWKTIKLGDGIDSSVAIGQNGIIYVAVKVGETAKVIALKTNCTGLADGGWPMYAKNAKHTGR